MEWTPKIKKLARETAHTVVALNNHPKGKAIENSRMMIELLEGAD